MAHNRNTEVSQRTKRLTELIHIAYGLTGTEITDLQAMGISEELGQYPMADVEVALKACRRYGGKLTLAVILQHLPNGHPGPEEAWAIVGPVLTSEAATIVWTEEMREAFGVCRSLSDDPVAARLAFREAYIGAVERARQGRQAPVWSASLGHDPAGREPVLREAVRRGRLPESELRLFLPPPPLSPTVLGLIASATPKGLPAPSKSRKRS